MSNGKSEVILSEALILSHLNYGDVVYGPRSTAYDAAKDSKFMWEIDFGLTSILSYRFKEYFFQNSVLYDKIKYHSDIHSVNTRFKHIP